MNPFHFRIIQLIALHGPCAFKEPSHGNKTMSLERNSGSMAIHGNHVMRSDDVNPGCDDNILSLDRLFTHRFLIAVALARLQSAVLTPFASPGGV